MEEDIVIKSPLNKTFIDKFLFTFNLPEALKNVAKEYNLISSSIGIGKDSIDFSIISASVPGITIKAFDQQAFGGHLHVSSHTKDAYEPITIKFKIDSNFANYFTIYQWINLLWDESAGHFDGHNLASGNSINDYQTQMSIIALDEYNNPITHWIFTHAFPTSLSSIDWNYQATDEIECSATFVFSQMIVRNIAFERVKTKLVTRH